MAKPGNKSNTNVASEATFEYMGTKRENVKQVLDKNFGFYLAQHYPVLNEEDIIKDKAVIAEDSKGYYITAKSLTECNVLDPYRLYRRIVVTAQPDENGKFNID